MCEDPAQMLVVKTRWCWG